MKALSKTKIVVSIFGLLVLVVGVTAAFLLTRQNQDIRPKAAGEAVLSLTSPTVSPQTLDVNFTTQVAVDTNSQLVFGVDAKLKFDPEVLQVVSVTPTIDTQFSSFPSTLYDNQLGTITIGANVGGGQAVIGSNITIANIVFTPISLSNSTSVEFEFTNPDDPNDSNVVLAVESGESPVDILGSVQDYNLSIIAPVVQSVPSLYLSDPEPTNPQITNRNFKIDVLADTAGQQVAGVDVFLNFDKNALEVVSLDEPTNPQFPNYPIVDYDQQIGRIAISANLGTGTDLTISGNNILLASITFKPLVATSSANLAFDFVPNQPNDSNMVTLAANGEDPTDILENVIGSSFVIVNDGVGGGDTTQNNADNTTKDNDDQDTNQNSSSNTNNIGVTSPTPTPTPSPTTSTPTPTPAQKTSTTQPAMPAALPETGSADLALLALVTSSLAFGLALVIHRLNQ